MAYLMSELHRRAPRPGCCLSARPGPGWRGAAQAGLRAPGDPAGPRCLPSSLGMCTGSCSRCTGGRSGVCCPNSSRSAPGDTRDTWVVRGPEGTTLTQHPLHSSMAADCNQDMNTKQRQLPFTSSYNADTFPACPQLPALCSTGSSHRKCWSTFPL